MNAWYAGPQYRVSDALRRRPMLHISRSMKPRDPSCGQQRLEAVWSSGTDQAQMKSQGPLMEEDLRPGRWRLHVHARC